MKKISIILSTFLIAFYIIACSDEKSETKEDLESPNTIGDYLFINCDSNKAVTLDVPTTEFKKNKLPCNWDIYLKNEGLVNIQDIDSTILVDLKYSTEDNFMEKDMYGCLENCYLQPDVAERLKLAQAYLKKKDSTLTLLIYDGVRPRSVQQYMWDLLDMPLNEKTKFVSNPKRGSLHNFGAALDITLADAATQEALDMGAEYDQIGIISWPIKEKIMLDSCLLTVEQVDNRKLLRRTMRAGKFFNIQTEWWHFNACYRDSAYVKYHIVEGMEFGDSIVD